jgi:hypothetical protein
VRGFPSDFDWSNLLHESRHFKVRLTFSMGKLTFSIQPVYH